MLGVNLRDKGQVIIIRLFLCLVGGGGVGFILVIYWGV